jgi:hypothetical protein
MKQHRRAKDVEQGSDDSLSLGEQLLREEIKSEEPCDGGENRHGTPGDKRVVTPFDDRRCNPILEGRLPVREFAMHGDEFILLPILVDLLGVLEIDRLVVEDRERCEGKESAEKKKP